ncbi:transport and Golgi organization 2 homolog [Penaeus monodon]|uniref:transport and Golgi organization 2 homolog n=1 Tax=Penaeus monodon TaxID=6687 RepID=UPI0018A73C99|nr:transport and Golgi organization 2 homolog [Penaeus monodon]
MCLLFVYINPDPKEGEYKVILVNNRDEFYSRPTKPAYFWDSGILGGADMYTGREGGTWLGMTENGNIACLLNILKPREEFMKDGAARGFLGYGLISDTDPLFWTLVVNQRAPV